MINSKEDIKKFINDNGYKKIFVLCGKKSFVTSGAEFFFKEIAKFSFEYKLLWSYDHLPYV